LKYFDTDLTNNGKKLFFVEKRRRRRTPLQRLAHFWTRQTARLRPKAFLTLMMMMMMMKPRQLTAI